MKQITWLIHRKMTLYVSWNLSFETDGPEIQNVYPRLTFYGTEASY